MPKGKSLRDLMLQVGFEGTKALKGLKDVDKAADKTKKELDDLGKEITDTGKGLDDISRDSASAKRSLDSLGRGLDSAKRKTKELGTEAKKVGTQLRTDFKQAMEDATPKTYMEGVAGTARGLGTAAMIGGAAGAATLGASAKGAISFESAFAGVRKTVDATEKEYAAIRKQIRGLTKEIPATHEEISAVAEAAGQLGISKTGLIGFTETMINLGETTNMASTEAADSLARFSNITQMSEDNYGRLGSTVVALGNNLATTESEIVEMGMRLAGAGAQIGMAEHSIMAFAGALSSVGIEAQAGGTAFSKIMIEMASQVATNGEQLGLFAKVAGMSVDKFKTLYKEDASEAIITFVEGLGRMSTAGENVFGVLEDLGFSEIRVRDALLRASGAGDLFRKSLGIGSEAWEKNIALTKEAQERYKTTASRLTIAKNKIRDLGITLGDILLPGIIGVSDAAGKLSDFLNKLPPGVQKVAAYAMVAGTGLMLLAGPALLLIGFLPQIAEGFAMVKMALGGVSLATLGPIALGIAAIAAAGYLVYRNWDKLKEFGGVLWKSFRAEIEPFVPYIQNVFSTVKSIITVGLQIIGGVIKFAILPIGVVFTYTWELIKNTVVTAVQTIGGVIGSLMRTLSGIIDFVKGVFTGNWKLAWEGVKNIFGGILDGLGAIAKGAINTVIGIINAGISGINKLKLGLGGKGKPIPKIPKLAQGTDFFRGGLAVVGERGPELVHLPRGSRVTSHDESTQMLRGGSGSGTNVFAPEINITIEGGSGSVKESMPSIKREVKKAIYPLLEAYFAELSTKRPSLTEA